MPRTARSCALLVATLLLARHCARGAHRSFHDRPEAERPFFLGLLENSRDARVYGADDPRALYGTIGTLLGAMQARRRALLSHPVERVVRHMFSGHSSV